MMKTSILAGLCLVVFSACMQDDSEGGAKIHLTLRPDAVEPPAPIDYEIMVNGKVRKDSNVVAGNTIDMGMVSPDTKVAFRVFNRRGAGAVYANILTDNCFRKTGQCLGEDCVAVAEYTVIEEECVNF